MFALVPMVVMALPVTLMLGQVALWYESRPLAVGEPAVITLRLAGEAEAPWPAVTLVPTNAVQVTVGPVHVRKTREVCWNVTAREPGNHRLSFQVGDRVLAKEIAIGDGFMRVSAVRPGWDWSSILLNPWERPFRPDDPVQSIAIVYPERPSKVSGTFWWMFYWFGVSMVAAFCFRGVMKVNL